MGGNGRDTIYAPYFPNDSVVASGGGGKDLIKFDIFDDLATPHVPNNGIVYLFGDWGYGPEDDPYDLNRLNQYTDSRLEKKLHGDDDIILTGDGGGNYGGGAPIYTFAGDGDDVIVQGKDWAIAEVNAGSGDDKITVENGWAAGGSSYFIFGEDGDDIIQGNQDGETQEHVRILIEGGDGNDRISGISGA